MTEWTKEQLEAEMLVIDDPRKGDMTKVFPFWFQPRSGQMSELPKVFEVIVRTKPVPTGRSLAEKSEPEILLALTGEKALQCNSAEDAKTDAIRRLDEGGAKNAVGERYRLDELEVLVRPFC